MVWSLTYQPPTEGRRFESFRITARRAFKTSPLSSLEMNRELGAHVLARHPTRVSLEHPELNVHVEVLPGQAVCVGAMYVHARERQRFRLETAQEPATVVRDECEALGHAGRAGTPGGWPRTERASRRPW